MALKSKITKEEFDALPDALKEHYKEANGSYLLDADDAAELRRAKERADEEARAAREERDRLKREKDEADAAARAATEEAARKKGDTAALDASWQAKLDAEKTAGGEREAKLKAQIEKLLVANVAKSIAAEISTVPELLEPAISARLKADLDGETPVTRVIDGAGALSAKTLDELKQEFVANEKFAAIIIGSKAKGGGAASASPAGGGAAKKISEMSEAERVTLYQQLGAVEYERRAAAERPA